MPCSNCNKLDDEPVNPNVINCGYCWYKVKRVMPENFLTWEPLVLEGVFPPQIVTSCNDGCVCIEPNFEPGNMNVGDVVSVPCGQESSRVLNQCCTNNCSYKIVYKNPLMPQLGKKWVLFQNNCNSTCQFPEVCLCQTPNGVPDGLPIGTEVTTACLFGRLG